MVFSLLGQPVHRDHPVRLQQQQCQHRPLPWPDVWGGDPPHGWIATLQTHVSPRSLLSWSSWPPNIPHPGPLARWGREPRRPDCVLLA